MSALIRIRWKAIIPGHPLKKESWPPLKGQSIPENDLYIAPATKPPELPVKWTLPLKQFSPPLQRAQIKAANRKALEKIKSFAADLCKNEEIEECKVVGTANENLFSFFANEVVILLTMLVLIVVTVYLLKRRRPNGTTVTEAQRLRGKNLPPVIGEQTATHEAQTKLLHERERTCALNQLDIIVEPELLAGGGYDYDYGETKTIGVRKTNNSYGSVNQPCESGKLGCVAPK